MPAWLLSAALSCPPVQGQAGSDQGVPAPADEKADELSEIVVTGSRIARPADERLQPTIVIDAQRIEDRQFINVADALKQLPAFSTLGNSLQGGQSQFSLGQSFANLFALGSNRTLTLIDGHRAVSGDSITTQTASGLGGEEVDLNSIPTQLIDRIEVVSVGGAPIYGSEAIAGTVNIIMKHDFQGLVIDAQRGVSGQGDARQSRVRLLGGFNFDEGRGNLEANVELAKTPELVHDQRQLYRYGNSFVNTDGSTPFQYQLYPNVRLGGVSTGGVPTLSDTYLNFDPGSAVRNTAGQILAFNAQGQLASFAPGMPIGDGFFNTGGDGYDFNSAASILTGEERINGNLLGRFDVSEHLRVTAEASFSETHNRGLTYGGNIDSAVCNGAGLPCGNLIVSASNPFLSAADQATIARNLAAYSAIPGNPAQTSQFYLGRFDLDTESDISSVDQNMKSFRLGVSGSLPGSGHDIKYELYGSYGWLTNATVTPAINYQNFYNAINAVTSASGAIVCAPGYQNSPVATQSSQCAAYDPFGVGHQSPASLAYVTDLASATSSNTLRDLEASINGSLFSVPAGAVKFAAGYENRRESMAFDPDQFYQQGAGQFSPIAPVAGAFHTNELFGELLVPLVAPAEDIPLVHRIELEGAARRVDHSISGKMTTWTAGLRYEPASFLQLRGSYVKSIRAPSLTESYTPPSFASEDVDDPCDQQNINSGPNPKARAANCAAAGIQQPFSSTFQNFNGEQIVYSGNPHLHNEQAASRALGFEIKPRDNFSLSVDYISINLTQAIQELDSDSVLDACYDASSIANSYCAHITRGADGQLQQIRPGFFNEGHLITNGVTGAFRYEADVPFAPVPGALGTLDFNVDYYFQNRGALYVGDSDYTSIAGTIANSKHQSTFDLAWRKGGLHADWNLVFVGHAAVDNGLPVDYASTERIGAWWLNNVSVAYELGRHLRAQLNVDNLFDKEPPYPLPGGAAQFHRRWHSPLLQRHHRSIFHPVGCLSPVNRTASQDDRRSSQGVGDATLRSDRLRAKKSPGG